MRKDRSEFDAAQIRGRRCLTSVTGIQLEPFASLLAHGVQVVIWILKGHDFGRITNATKSVELSGRLMTPPEAHTASKPGRLCPA
jgi:hypothetical protein